jgi:hypothetical protein
MDGEKSVGRGTRKQLVQKVIEKMDLAGGVTAQLNTGP